jgi:hypothetical protein
MHKRNAIQRNFLDHVRQLRTTEQIGFFIVFLLLVGFVTVGAHFQWQSILRDKKSYIELIGQSKIGQLESWYDSQLSEAKELPASPVFIDIVAQAIEKPSSQNLARIDDYLRPILRSYNYADSAVLTPDFHVLVSLTQLAESNCPEVCEEISRKDSLAPFFTTLHLTSPYGKPGFHLVIPLVKDRQKAPFAYVVQTFFAGDYLYPMLARWPGNEKTGETLLLERTDDMVQVLNPLKLVNISAFSLQVSVSDKNAVEARAGLGQTGVMVGKDYRGKRVLAVVNRVPELGWTILSKMDYAETMSSWIPTLVIIIVFSSSLRLPQSSQARMCSSSYPRTLRLPLASRTSPAHRAQRGLAHRDSRACRCPCGHNRKIFRHFNSRPGNSKSTSMISLQTT